MLLVLVSHIIIRRPRIQACFLRTVLHGFGEGSLMDSGSAPTRHPQGLMYPRLASNHYVVEDNLPVYLLHVGITSVGYHVLFSGVLQVEPGLST